MSRPVESGPIGIVGGTFDPIHYGHLRLAEEARETLGLSSVHLIPSGQPPHRSAPRTPALLRLELARLAVAGNPALEVDGLEVESPDPSYTVLTLEALRQRLGPSQPLVLILGADAFEGLPTWYRWHELLALAHIAVANRPGYAPHGRRWPDVQSPELAAACTGRIGRDPAVLRLAPAGRVVTFDMTPLAISASLIRDLLRTGHSARYLLPDGVLDYIQTHGLYR
ncbi:MAG: nicotinate-nucleotide adenylyltransferase [Rhodocyclaceae bacterium]|jgi:nicotinate-nucleotide adenylyltransferase|nr:nicotinate-nucleotide adenylyltransferase [Rhodocyclaceae bacterium]